MKSSGAKAELDIWRDSPLRYVGYMNELGESFRPLFPRLVVPSYVVSFGYVFCDTADKTRKAQKEAEQLDPRLRTLHVASTAIDTLVWQSLASVLIPGVVIHKIVDVSCDVLAGKYPALPLKNVPHSVRRWGPTGVGLATIPLVIHPLDNFVHFLMDLTLRPAFGYMAHRQMKDTE